MINNWLRESKAFYVAMTEADGFFTWYGKGYEKLEHWGMGPNRPELPPHACAVVMGSADKHILDQARYPFVLEHWR